MAKIKLMRFELIAMLEESKRLIDYLQKIGVTELSDVETDELTKYQTSVITSALDRKQAAVQSAVAAVEKYGSIKRSFIQSFTDYTEIDYHEYRRIGEQADEMSSLCEKINSLQDEIQTLKADIVRWQTKIDYYKPWEKLDIPMSTVRTPSTSIFIGMFRSMLTEQDILNNIASEIPEIDGVTAEVISSSKIETCCVVMCHKSDSAEVEAALKATGFIRPDNPAKKLPSSAINECEEKITEANAEIEKCKLEIAKYVPDYDRMRLLADYYGAQKEKYLSMEKAATSSKAIYLEGFVPERDAEQLKFEVEKRFTCQMELSEPDYEDDNTPVLIENGDFASGVESITNMYSAPSNKDLDPNPVMSFFYYLLFGMMLSDAGYGLLMVILGLVAKYKIKVQGNTRKTVNFVLYSGISTTIWGLLFGGFFGDLIQTVATNFFGVENPPSIALWFEPTTDSIKLMLFSFLIGIIHLFAGLAMRFATLVKQHDIFGAICDTVPVYLFVIGFAVIGKDFIEPVSAQVKSIGTKIFIAGCILIILTAGRSAKNIVGKLGGGLYALYNNTTGYLGDVLSYSRLLALNLVTGVIASVVNMLGAMMGNIVVFIIIFIAGHAMNIAINLIGTYVHTCRLQYVEYFSKFYGGGGKLFTPFKLNLKHFKFKEETIND